MDMRNQPQTPALSSPLLSAVWIRSGGRCECSSSCAHHETSVCGNRLLPGKWSAHRILPAWLKSEHDGVSTFEAVCESCREYQDLVGGASASIRAEYADLGQLGNVK